VGVKGAFIGNAAASIVGLAAARLLAGSVKSEDRYPMRKMIGFVAGTAVLAVIYTLLISMDIFVVEVLVRDKTLVGMYVAAATLAKAPFFLFLAITNVTLPSVSRALASEDNELAKRYVGQSFRLHLMLLMPLTAVVSASSKGIVSLIYRSGYAGASLALSILITAFMFWGLLNGVNNIMLARRQTVYPVVSTLTLIAIMILLCWKMVTLWGIVGAAAAAAVTGCIGLLIAVLMAYKQGGFHIPGWSVVRVTLASAVAYAVARMAGTDILQVLFITSASVVIYFLVLIISGEITKKDIFSLANAGRF
jgi:O-antigen/teichoic acid export membrane protein